MIKEEIESKLKVDCEPWYLEVINESPNHNVPDGAESHFKVIVVSTGFENLRVVQRHQKIYSILDEEMKKIHAIAIHPFTPDEWKDKTGDELESPKCLGGGHD